MNKEAVKKAIRTLSNSKYNLHATPLFKNLELLKAQDSQKLYSKK